jgi:hypothetical protein
MKYPNTTFWTSSHTSYHTSISKKLLPYSFLICLYSSMKLKVDAYHDLVGINLSNSGLFIRYSLYSSMKLKVDAYHDLYLICLEDYLCNIIKQLGSI